ncbi:DNA adenine methylase [Rathayibacter tritici]|nr:DNA adenine methylase [Rathayibacter tritici]
MSEVQRQLDAIAPISALVRGKATTGDSVDFADNYARPGDLVFCDPPYSDAQYGRFYHVLEGIARGGWEGVFGAGRAPVNSDRPSSDFSRRTQAVNATGKLLTALAANQTTVLWTYPEGVRSNGLTVTDIRMLAEPIFKVTELRIPMRHSTLGGSEVNHKDRHGRRDLHEVLFRLESRA